MLCLLLLDLGEALAAVDRTISARLKGNLGFLTAVGADAYIGLSLASGSVLACVAASFASLRLVLEAFGSIKLLLTGCEYELIAAFFAN